MYLILINMEIEVKVTDNGITNTYNIKSILLDDEELKRLIWEEWESEIKEEDPRQMVLKYMKMMRKVFIKK